MKTLFLLAFTSINAFGPKALHRFSEIFYSTNCTNFKIGVATADIAATLVGYTAVHVRNLDIHDVVPVHDQLLNAHRHSFREQPIRGTRLFDITFDAFERFLRQSYDLSMVVNT